MAFRKGLPGFSAGQTCVCRDNAAGHPNATLLSTYARLGYVFASENVISSRMTILAALEQEPTCRWGAMLSRAAGLQDLEHLDLKLLALDSAA